MPTNPHPTETRDRKCPSSDGRCDPNRCVEGLMTWLLHGNAKPCLACGHYLTDQSKRK